MAGLGMLVQIFFWKINVLATPFQHDSGKYHDRAGHDGYISHIEYTCPEDDKVDMEEVGYRTVHEPVVDISDSASDYKTNSQEWTTGYMRFKEKEA